MYQKMPPQICSINMKGKSMSHSCYHHNGDFKITKREVLFSIIIVAVLLFIGFVISSKISDNLYEEYQKYNTALQVEDNKELFEYGMRTDIGNAFVYGNLEAVDTVTYPEIGGKYSYVEKVKEKYTMHTRVVTTTDGKGRTYTRTETYWTWDKVGSEDKHCKQISFLDITFKYGMIPFPSSSYITTIKESSHIRYQYYGTGIKYIGTLCTVLGDNTISETKFYENQSISETIESLESNWKLIIFWVLWIIGMVIVIIDFYYIDNKWLE